MRNIRITEAGSGGSRGISTGGGTSKKTVKRNPDGSAKKPGKPKPTAGKGIFKNINTAGGKRGRAIENKMRSEINMDKGITTGKQKAINKANYKIGDIRRTEGVGAVKVTKSAKLKEFMSDAPVKGTARKVRDNAQRAELEAKGYSKRASLPKFPSKKILGNKDKPTTPKVPVKKKSK